MLLLADRDDVNCFACRGRRTTLRCIGAWIECITSPIREAIDEGLRKQSLLILELLLLLSIQEIWPVSNDRRLAFKLGNEVICLLKRLYLLLTLNCFLLGHELQSIYEQLVHLDVLNGLLL